MPYRISSDGRWTTHQSERAHDTLYVLLDPNIGTILLHGLGLAGLLHGQRIQDTLPWETRLVAFDLPALSKDQANTLLRALETTDAAFHLLALPHRLCTERNLCLRARDATPCIDSQGRPFTSLRIRPDSIPDQGWLAVRLPGHPTLPVGEFLWRGRIVRQSDSPTPILYGEILELPTS